MLTAMRRVEADLPGPDRLVLVAPELLDNSYCKGSRRALWEATAEMPSPPWLGPEQATAFRDLYLHGTAIRDLDWRQHPIYAPLDLLRHPSFPKTSPAMPRLFSDILSALRETVGQHLLAC